jgi:hypothetical protein
MNERIRQLAVEAGYETDMFDIGHWDMPEFKKFTQLLIAECCTLIDAMQYDAPGFIIQAPAHAHILKIKKHFGVE